MKPQYTPGPWVVFEETGQYPGIDSSVGHSVVLWGSNEDDGGIRGRTPAEETANAKLIAAAPQLAEALQRALRDSGCDGDLCNRAWHDDARRALDTAGIEP